MYLAFQDSVRAEIRLTDEQADGLEQIAKARREHSADWDDAEVEAGMSELLDAGQVRRLRQIALQYRGTHALTDPDVADTLGLAPDQTDEIRAVLDDARQRMWAIIGFGPDPDWRAKSRQFWAGVGDRVLAVLTPDQRADWADELGEPFAGEIQFREFEPVRPETAARPTGRRIARSPVRPEACNSYTPPGDHRSACSSYTSKHARRRIRRSRPIPQVRSQPTVIFTGNVSSRWCAPPGTATACRVATPSRKPGVPPASTPPASPVPEVKGMTLRRLAYYIAVPLAAACAAPAAAQSRVATDNFIVEAANRELAERFAREAEKFRREKAEQWLGYEMPTWPQKCPLKVKVTMGQTGGATTFTFGSDGQRSIVSSQEMQIFGGMEQLLFSVLPHEITHTVLAHHFGQPVPRWADEGGSVLSENDDERFNHDVRCREILNQGRGIPLRALFAMKEYPRDMIVLYAQGYSITSYLVAEGGGGQEGRAKLLQFLAVGMRNDNRNWEQAVQQVYGYGSVDELQETWIGALRTPPSRIAARDAGNASDRAAGTPTGRRPRTEAVASLASSEVGRGRPEVRTSTVPASLMLEPPIVARGVAPADDTGRTFANTAPAPRPPLPRLLPPEPPSR